MPKKKDNAKKTFNTLAELMNTYFPNRELELLFKESKPNESFYDEVKRIIQPQSVQPAKEN